MKNTFIVGSSQGEFVVDKETGTVIEFRDAGEYISMESYMNSIKKFDVQEWKERYKREIPEYIDILDLGNWYKNKAGINNEEETLYEPPVQDWRDEYRRLDKLPLREGDKFTSLIDNKNYYVTEIIGKRIYVKMITDTPMQDDSYLSGEHIWEGKGKYIKI